jgi:hypothetical protein
MASLKTTAIAVLTATSIGSAALMTPAFAGQSKVGVDASRLDKAPADYSQYYRRGWYRGGYNRGAAVAAGVGLGVLGAAAIAANRRAYYGDPYYYNDGYYAAPAYGYGYAPVYAEPPVVYAPRPRYYAPRYGYGYIPDNIRDPAGGSYR